MMRGENEMVRDEGLEELLNDDLADVPGLNQKAMFGGWGWLLNGNLLCGARDDGMLARLGKNNDAWQPCFSQVRSSVETTSTRSGKDARCCHPCVRGRLR
jgi:hypothetical protein